MLFEIEKVFLSSLALELVFPLEVAWKSGMNEC